MMETGNANIAYWSADAIYNYAIIESADDVFAGVGRSLPLFGNLEKHTHSILRHNACT